MKRLYLRLYLAFLAITALSLVVTAVLARAFHEPGGPLTRYLAPLARSLTCAQPEHCAGEPAERLRETSRDLGVDIVVWDDRGSTLFSATRSPLSFPGRPGWHHTPHGALWVSSVDGGRLLGLRERGHFGPRGRLFLPMLAAVALVMAVGLYPFSRSITRRVERLAEGARRWGAGDLAHRVPVDGKDEIATLTQRFNQAAASIETLLAQERQMLATASHELRTPLARIRLALDLLAEEAAPERRAELARRSSDDIAELDALVEELLMAARTQVPNRPFVEVDVLDLVRAEAEAYGAEAAGTPARILGEPAMLKRMVRNLLANARQHGEGAVRAQVTAGDASVIIAVEDDGPGVSEGESERIFAPFYRPPGPRPATDRGVGLGLALVRQIARYHGGDVRYVGRQVGGSRFEVTIPVRA